MRLADHSRGRPVVRSTKNIANPNFKTHPVESSPPVGHRGASAVNLLTEMGFTNVSYVEGGMKKLLAAGLATE
jgi:hypothetical protein